MKDVLRKRKIEIGIVLFTIVWGILHAWFVYATGLTRLSVDQNSHLNIARLLSDSLTPGISQLGFWPPLLHIILAPFTAITPLFTSGLAGSFALVPILAAGSLCAYKIVKEFYPYEIPAIGAAALFITNPYILYYSVTPMTESLFIVSLLAVSFFLIRWIKEGKFGSLVYLGIFVALAGLARFEGFLLIPIVLTFVVLKLIRARKKYSEIEAISILFGLIATLGLGFTFIYGIAYGNGPLEFMSGQWSASSQQASLFLPTFGDIGMSLLYMFEASKLMFGPIMVPITITSAMLLVLLLSNTNRFLPFLGALTVLVSPFVFDVLALTQGSAVLYLDHLAPFDGYFNERYGLYWYGFAVLAPMLVLGLAMGRMTGILKISRYGFGTLVFVLLVGANLIFLNVTAYTDNYAIQRGSAVSTLPADQKDLAIVLGQKYDGGKIFITRALQNYVTIEAGIPLKNYIHESNDEYYAQALGAPWFYARWVIMYNPKIEGIEDWRRESERISQAWAHSENFHHAYELVYENKSERLYRLRDDVVVQVASLYGIDPALIPSLNEDIIYWDQAEFYETLQDGVSSYWDARAAREQQIATARIMNRKN